MLKPGLDLEAAVLNESSRATAYWRRVLPSKFFMFVESFILCLSGTETR